MGLGNIYAKGHWGSECSSGTREMQGVLRLFVEYSSIHLRPLRRQSTIIHGWNGYRNAGMFSKSCSKRHCRTDSSSGGREHEAQQWIPETGLGLITCIVN